MLTAFPSRLNEGCRVYRVLFAPSILQNGNVLEVHMPVFETSCSYLLQFALLHQGLAVASKVTEGRVS